MTDDRGQSNFCNREHDNEGPGRGRFLGKSLQFVTGGAVFRATPIRGPAVVRAHGILIARSSIQRS